MTMPAWQSSISQSAYDAPYDSDHKLSTLSPGERISPTSSRKSDGSALRGIALLVVVLAGGWALIGDRAALGEWVRLVASSLQAPPAPPLPRENALDAPLASSAAASDLMPMLVATDVPPAPVVAAVAVVAPTPSEASAVTSDAVVPLPPPVANPSDPYETRALAAGLHPGLSRVLLTRLTDTDYRNAATAIQKAIAETPDSGVFIWPRQRKPELALFRVGFVPGAAPHCRRYVVIVTKDGWSTTALPMERCSPPADKKGL